MEGTSLAAAVRRRAAEADPLHQRFAASALVVLVGLLATLLAFFLQRSAVLNSSERDFTSWSDDRREALQRVLDAHLEVLHGVRALFDSSEHVNSQEFARFTAAPLRRYAHIQSLDWLARVPYERREQFERDVSAELGRSYAIQAPEQDHDGIDPLLAGAYWPVMYTQNRDPALRLGFDERADPVRLDAMTNAARTNRATVAIVGRTMTNTGRFQVYLPVFSRGAKGTAQTPSGFVRSTFSLDQTLRELLSDVARSGVAAELIDARQGDVLGALTPASVPYTGRELIWNGRVMLADRALTLRFTGTSLYARYPRFTAAWITLAIGLTVTLLGALAAHQLTRRRLRLRQLTRELLAEVSERRLSEQRLVQSEARYRVLVENSPDAIMLNIDDRISFVNAACIRLLGARSADDVVGRPIYDFVDPAERDEVRARLTQMREQLIALPSVERHLVRLDGSMVEVESLVVPFKTADGVTLHVTSRDITERRAIEAERAALEAALRQSQKLEALGTLAGGIAHDFNNILSAIVGNTRLLSEDLPGSHPGASYIEEIRNATHRARDLVKRLMAFSRQQESQRTAVALQPLLTEVQQLLRATLPAGVELVVRVDRDIPPILGDATQIHQVLLNLCTNAWQAMRSHTGRIEIAVSTVSGETANAHSGSALEGAARYICIAVHDNGCGMSRETLDHIFEPFFTTKQPGEGSGLGLAVVHGIVQSHRGAISVVSEPNVGASFFVYLPASETPIETRRPDAAPAAPGAAQHVLYVDDEEPLVYLAQRMLERAGYRCTGCVDAAEAVQMVRRTPEAFDLVITDLNMPGMSGLDVARELLAIRRDLPIVITTGYVRAADVAAARELGVRDVMLKPDTIDELARSVQRYLPAAAIAG